MAESYISELGDSLSHGVANTNGDRVKIIAPKLYNDGNGNHPSIATALAGKAASNHSHGNIQNGGTLQTTDITIANGDKLVVTDSSDSSKVARASIAFDGSTTTQALTKAGTWATFNNYSLPLAASGTRGGIQIGYSESGTNYAVKLSSEKAYVTVPWTDTKVTQTKDDSDTTAYPLLMAGAADPNGTATTARYDSGVKLTPSTNTISANISGKAATAGTADKAVADKSGNDIEETYATKTELNAKQNNLTAGDNITIDGSTISSDQVFVATYGTTKYAEIKAEFDAGKICTLYNNSRYYYVIWINKDYIEFASSNESNTLYHASVSNINKWSSYTRKLQSELTFDDTPTSGSTNPVTSGGVKTAIDTVDAKGIVINEIDGENVICFE